MGRSLILFLFLLEFIQSQAQAKAVGLTMAGTHAVSGSGASTYSIPLSLPKGTAGMEPILGLEYNSQGGDGPMGIGWNISGLGAITRTGKTLHHDQVSKGLQLDGTDNLALDGQRLLSTGSNEWMTEVAGFDKVSMVGGNTLITNTASFVVHTKNQQKIYYGSNADARQLAPGTGQVMAWYISKIEDAYGNYTEYHYNNDAAKGEVNISRISYTGNKKNKLSPYAFVAFHYSSKRLDSISVTNQDKLYRGYSIKYDSQQRVAKVMEHNIAGEWMESKFEWEGLSPKDKIVGFTNHLGVRTKVEYGILRCPATDSAGFRLAYPLKIQDTPMVVVNRVWIATDVKADARSDEKLYSYHTPVFHQLGKGFLGFRKIELNEVNRQKKTTTIQIFDGAYGLALPCSTIVSTTIAPSTLVHSSVEHIYNIHPLGGGRIFPYQQKTTKTDNTNGPITIETTVVTNPADLQKGNISGSATKYLRGTTLDEEVLNAANFDYAGHWGGRVSSALKAINRGALSHIESQSMTYNPQGSVLEQVEFAHLGSSEQVKTTNTYDAFGNVTSIAAQASGLSPRSKTMTFDPKGRFETSRANGIGHQYTQVTDPLTGQVTQRTDPNGLLTQMTYDNWGRITSTKSPDGSIIELRYRDAVGLPNAPTGNAANMDRQAVYAVSHKTQGINDEEVTFYNRHGRELREVSKGFAGQDVLVDYEYDEWGRLTEQTEPYFGGTGAGSVTKTVTGYDPLGRPILVEVTNGGQRTTISYDGQYGVQSNTGAKFTKVKKDATGKKIEQTDNGGTVSYTYHPNGKPSSVNAAGAVTTLEYDSRGFQRTLHEPNSGLTEYNHNAFGEIIWQNDSRQSEYQMQYDELGREVYKRGPEGEYITVYDPQNAKGQIANERFVPADPSHGSDVQYIYEYDALSRLGLKTEDLGGEIVKTGFFYDNYSRVIIESKSNGNCRLNYGAHVKEYNEQGYLNILRHSTFVPGTIPIWECLERNAKGQATIERMANGLVTSREYDVLGRPSGEKIMDGNWQFRHWKYTFYRPTGNLINRSDIIRSLAEDYVYDSLDRLTRVQGPRPLTMKYALNGDITYKSDAANEYLYGVEMQGEANSYSEFMPPFSLLEQEIFYTPFNKIQLIKERLARYVSYYGLRKKKVKGIFERPDYTTPSMTLKLACLHFDKIDIIEQSLSFCIPS